MKLLKKLFVKVESNEIAVRTNVSSGMMSFLRALESEPVVAKLFQLAKHPDRAPQILNRIREIAEFRVDPRYENPFDTALTAYLRVLQATHPELARIAASAVANAHNCWWATKVAHKIFSNRDISSGSVASQIVEVVFSESARAKSACPDSGESFVIATCPGFLPVRSTGQYEFLAPTTKNVTLAIEADWEKVPVHLLSDHSGMASMTHELH